MANKRVKVYDSYSEEDDEDEDLDELSSDEVGYNSDEGSNGEGWQMPEPVKATTSYGPEVITIRDDSDSSDDDDDADADDLAVSIDVMQM